MKNIKPKDGPESGTEPAASDIGKPRTLEDGVDLQRAHYPPDNLKKPKPWYTWIGPGLITGAADDDPSGIGTYSQSGASFGYSQLWLVLFCLPLMIAVQEMCGRVGLVTGQGIAAVMKEHYPKWLTFGALSLLVFANMMNVYADLNVMAASAKMLFGQSFYLWLTVVAVAIVGLTIAIPYRRYARWLKFLCLALAGYIVVALMPGIHSDWKLIFRDLLVPSWSNNTPYLIATVAFLGTTISPYLFYWQAGEEVEEVIAESKADGPGARKSRVQGRDLRNLRADTSLGMIASQAVAFFIMVATAGTLHASGKTDINTAQDAALALKPLGPAAFWIFSLGIIGTGMLAIPTLAGSSAYAAAESLGWRYGLYRRFSRARAFYITIALVVAVGYGLNFISKISPIKALIYSAVVNGIVAVPLIVVLILICNSRNIMGKRTNGPWSNLFGVASAIFMGIASSLFIWAVCTGKAG